MESIIAPQSRKIKPRNSQEFRCLPEEIIVEEILPKLPVKSLLQFRCVSKSWCSLIASKRFMKAHLRNSIKSSSFAHRRILFYTVDRFKQISLPSLFNEPLTDVITIKADIGINVQREDVYLVGSCNGLVCVLVDRKRFILWNPATKKYNNLPDFVNEMHGKAGKITKYGFGFDELNDDYKVYGLLYVVYESFRHLTIRKVYSLRTNSWEVIKGRDASPFDEAGMYVNGRLHWNIYDHGEYCIASFDLNSKVNGEIELPSYSKREFSQRVGVYKGCLSVHCFPRERYVGIWESHVDIWVMKEYGVKESWDKVATVPYYHGPCEWLFPKPLAIGPKGEVLLIYDSVFMIYNPKDNGFWHPKIINYAPFFESCIYVESLASVVPDDEQEHRVIS